MTLIAGFLCPDGFVITADTEVTLGDLRIQESKLIDSPGNMRAYRLVIGGAGDATYVDEAMQEIRDSVAAMRRPLIASVDKIIRKAIGRIHAENIFKYWEPGDDQRPRVYLILGLRDVSGKRCLWRTEDQTVAKVSASVYVGSGTLIASHIGEKLFRYGLPTAAVHHIATHILREAKAKGASVGGNTDTWSIQTQGAQPFFDIDDKDKRFLWGIEDALLSATRCALTRTDQVSMNARLEFIRQRLTEVHRQARTPLPTSDSEWHTSEILRTDLHPFSDL